jgi:predicted transcriptional regulator
LPTSTTLTVRLPKKVKDRLGQLARSTRRTRSYLAGEAIASFVDREIEIITGIKRGLEDMKAGRTTSHEDAMRRIDATIAAAAKKRR